MVMILQMVTSDVIFATGNTAIMSVLMVGGTVVNIIFDYLLIFGKYGFPQLEMAGAALATLIAQPMVLVAALIYSAKEMGLLHRRGHEVSILSSWSINNGLQHTGFTWNGSDSCKCGK
jgi:Na+-driven multidrug efflux pump